MTAIGPLLLRTTPVTPRDTSDSASVTPSSRLSLSLRTRRHSCQKLSAIGDIDGAASSKEISGGGSRPRSCAANTSGSPGGVGSSSATLKMPAASRANAASIACAMSATWMRLKTWPGLTMRRALPRAICSQRVAPGSVDAGEAQHGDGDAAALAEILPGVLGREPSPARAESGAAASPRPPRRRRGRRRRRPSTDRRSLADARACASASPKARKHRIAIFVWRNRDQRDIGFADRVHHFRRRDVAVEQRAPSAVRRDAH